MRFHKIADVDNNRPVQPAPGQPVMTPKQLEEQIDYSNKRKEFLDNKYTKEQYQKQQYRASLEGQREIVRKELENGAEIMYQEALNLYKQRHYTAAADRFQDVQEILPGYKRTGEYLDDARSKALNVPVRSSSPVSRQESISKALDLFEPNPNAH